MKAPGSMLAARGALLTAGARVLSRRGGEAVPVVLRLTAVARGRRLTVRVHDLLGRPLRTLVEGQRFDSEGAFLWDGRDERGAPVPPGLYVIRADALPEDGVPARASSVPLAVSAERGR
jgi:flagellar hook assembly protein FlgD